MLYLSLSFNEPVTSQVLSVQRGVQQVNVAVSERIVSTSRCAFIII